MKRILLLSFVSLSCSPPSFDSDHLKSEIQRLAEAADAEVGVYYEDLRTGDTLTVNPDLRMHAASTMKVPVMIQLFRDQDAGLIDLDDSLDVRLTFRSIVDSSTYEMAIGEDSDSTLYARLGEPVAIRDMIEQMITVSSNLATNILIEEVGAPRAQATMRTFGADSIQVLRGVEDIKAYEAGLSNTTTARDLGLILSALARGEAAGAAATDEMIGIMTRQHFRDGIPAGLPSGTEVANKTGNITGINHDAAIVRPNQPDSAYVLVVLTRGLELSEGEALIREISALVSEARH